MVLIDEHLRKLGVDDFLILVWIGDRFSLVEIGKKLMITPSAIVQRVRKMEEIFGGSLTFRDGSRTVKPTEKCLGLAKVAQEIIINVNHLV